MSKKFNDLFWNKPLFYVLFDIFVVEDRNYNVLHDAGKFKSDKGKSQQIDRPALPGCCQRKGSLPLLHLMSPCSPNYHHSTISWPMEQPSFAAVPLMIR